MDFIHHTVFLSCLRVFISLLLCTGGKLRLSHT